MKIVNREQFLQMPKGTVFCKIDLEDTDVGVRYVLNENELCILNDKPWLVDEDDGTIDYFYIALGKMLDPKDETIEDYEAMCRMRAGEEIAFEHIGERDGLFEYDNIGYMIFQREEIEDMIALLQQSLDTMR